MMAVDRPTSMDTHSKLVHAMSHQTMGTGVPGQTTTPGGIRT